VAVEWGRDKSAFWLQVLNDHWLGDGRTWLTGEAITVADYFVGGLVALGDIIRWDFGRYPHVQRWLGRVKALPHWSEVSAAIDGFAASLKDREFVVA
jgi:glutathione S-transferase